MEASNCSSLNLTYVLGKLVQATTSGDGFVGSDKTAKTKMMTKIPQELPEQWSGQISGEAHLTDSSFAELNEILAAEGSDLQKTSRNSAAGLINSENLTNPEKKSGCDRTVKAGNAIIPKPINPKSM